MNWKYVHNFDEVLFDYDTSLLLSFCDMLNHYKTLIGSILRLVCINSRVNNNWKEQAAIADTSH